jgi:hypothetical protein
MKATLSKRRHAAPSHKRTKHRPVRHARKAHHAKASVVTPSIVAPETAEDPVAESVSPFSDLVTDKRDEELSDEEALDREERQDLY